jgi:hypothetical protein
MNLLFLFSLLILTGIVINQKIVAEAIRKLLLPKPELMPSTVAVKKAVKKQR